MLIFNQIFNNQIAVMILSLIVFLFIFYALGRIIQNYFSFEKSNYFLSIPIGFLFYFINNDFFYLVSIFIGIQVESFVLIEIIKNITILLFILVFYKHWFKIAIPSYYWIKIIPITSVVIILPLITYFLIDSNLIILNDSLINSIKQIEFGNFNTEWSNNQITETLESYQTMYYWIYTTTLLMFGNVEFVNETVRYFLPTMLLIIIVFSILATFIDFERSVSSMAISTMLSTIFSLILVFITPNSLIFYAIPIAIIFILFNYSYSIKKEPNNNMILASFVTLIIFQSVTSYAIILLIIFGAGTILLLIIKEGKIVKNMIIYFSLIFLALIFSIIFIIFDDIATITGFIIYLIISTMLFAIITIPLYSLSSSKNRREDLQSFEEKMHNRVSIIIFSISIFFTIISLFWLLTNSNLVFRVDSFFLSISSNYAISIIIYFTTLFIPSILLISIKKIKYNIPMLTMFSFINLLFNPITLPILTSIIGIELNIYLIFAPSIIIILTWLAGVTLNLIGGSISL